MNENESILYIKIKLGKRSICVKYAIRFLSVAAFFLMIEQTSFFITRQQKICWQIKNKKKF